MKLIGGLLYHGLPTGVVRRYFARLLLALAIMASGSSVFAKVSDFSLRDLEGKTRELYQEKEARAVVLMFTITGCPIVQKSIPKIKDLQHRFGPKGMVFWLVNSSPEDDPASIRAEARDFGINMPILLDHSQTAARSLNATRTAEAICIDPRSWTIFYRGAIDDQLGYGTERRQASHPYLKRALDNFLAGKPVDPAQTEVRGCRIQFESSSNGPAR